MQRKAVLMIAVESLIANLCNLPEMYYICSIAGKMAIRPKWGDGSPRTINNN